jgi:hypothetical protein
MAVSDTERRRERLRSGLIALDVCAGARRGDGDVREGAAEVGAERVGLGQRGHRVFTDQVDQGFAEATDHAASLDLATKPRWDRAVGSPDGAGVSTAVPG